MKHLYHSFLLLLASATDKQLVRYLQFLKAENRILRSKLPRRIPVSLQERRQLLKFGKPVGAAIKELITIVSPRTFVRWVNAESQLTKKAVTPKLGRPRTREALRELIIRIARETGWGYTRILGELKKLGVGNVARSTVVNILKEHGFDPGPKRGEGTWDEFIKIHIDTLWACDFFSKKVWTLSGLVEYFIFFVIHFGSRRIHIAGMTPHPDRPWMAQQARNLSMYFGDQPKFPRFLLRDNDGKFSPQFDAILRFDAIEVKPITPLSPNMNAVAERWVQSVKHELLDHFIVFGEAHLRHLLSQFETYYNQCRPHQTMDNRPPNWKPPPGEALGSSHDVVCEKRLGGLLKHYHRRAA